MVRLEICSQCQKHGHIVLACGFVGPEFAFQKQGVEVVRGGLEFERFTPAEAEALEKAIIASPLPVNWDCQDLKILYKIEVYNSLRAEDHYLDVPPHDVLQTPLDDNEIPPDFVDTYRKHFAGH